MAGKAEVIEAIKAHKRSRDALEFAMQKAFPVGSLVNYEKRGTRQTGKVLFKPGHDRMKVENIHTGKSYFITPYDIFGYVE